MICLRKKMNRFFRKSKSPSPNLSEKSKLKSPSSSETARHSLAEQEPLAPKGVAVDDSSLSEHSHVSSCTASDDSKDFPNVVTLEVPVTKSRSLSFDGMIRTLNQLGSKDAFLKVPANDRSWAECGKGSLSSQTNSTSQSTSNLTLMSAPGQSSSPKGSEPQFKCIHCMYLNSLAEADNFAVVGDLCGQAMVASVPPRAGQRASISSNSSCCSAVTGSDLSDFSENESSDKSSTSSTFQRGGINSYGSRNLQNMERLSPPIFVSAADPFPLAPMIVNEGISRNNDSAPSFDVNSYAVEGKEEAGNEPNSCADSEKASTCSNFSLSSSCDPLETRISDWKEAVTLQVPLFKPRSSSLDVQYNIELHAGNSGGSCDDRRSSCEQLLSVEGDPYKQQRSTSVDVSLPTEGSTDYKAILVHHESNKKAIASQHNSNFLHPRHAEFGFKKREPRSTVDWSESANNGEHIWVDTNASGDSCYLGESECVRSGIRKKCVSCKIVAHTLCISRLEQMLLRCKPTFCEGSHRNYRENTVTRHHWVHRRRQDGKCSKCGKSFQQRFSFQSKEIIAIGCSWCKLAYHNKAACFPMSSLEEKCTLGEHAKVVIPPSWIIKLPRKGYFKSSVCRKKKLPLKKRDSKEDQFKSFIVKPIPSPTLKPLLVLINPRSGGNQGTKIMHKFFWYLNPRQVFDITQTKPQVALELYHKVMNLRILACGGDGTVGWILSVIDHLAMNPPPPVAILPLGTGNDMARTLNWGGGYTDEPVGKILNSIEESVVVQVDRWNLTVESLPSYEEATTTGGSGLGGDEVGVTNLPINVMNNYFSIGADANVTLEFHESREAKPEKFNSRFRNKMFYAGVGGIDILKRSWKDLTEYISVECDGQNFDSVVRQSKFHCLLFLNIPKYAAGTNPWGNSSSGNFRPQRPDDGFLEVVGFTAASLASLQMGAHSGVRVTQCRHARLTTYKPMPVQVDGEPCRLVPSIIDIARRNQANMLQKPKLRGSTLLLNLSQPSDQGPPRILVRLVTMGDYESLNHDKEKLNKASICMTTIEADSNCDLSEVRKIIRTELSRTFPNGVSRVPGLSGQWSFIDTLTADQCFRIPRSKEHQHYITDVTSNDVFLLDPRNPLVLYAEPDDSTSVEELHASVPVVNSSSNLSSDEQKSSQSSDTEEMRIQSEKDYAGSVFLLACKSGDLNTIANLKNLTDFSVLDSITGMTGLHYSAMHGHTPVIEYLIHEVSPAILDSVELGKSQTALHKAASIVSRKICIHLVVAGCKSTLRDSEGFLPSMLALQSNDVELSKFLKRVEKAEFRDLGMSESLSPDSCSEAEIDQEAEADL